MPSTVIRYHTYDTQTRDLTITFVSGRRYVYAKVPPRVAAAFAQAPSRGAWFNHHIRDHFAYREVLPSGVDRD
ncbi:MAG: KTSC domain-containing protein [Tardiphaga sp.]